MPGSARGSPQGGHLLLDEVGAMLVPPPWGDADGSEQHPRGAQGRAGPLQRLRTAGDIWSFKL